VNDERGVVSSRNNAQTIMNGGSAARVVKNRAGLARALVIALLPALFAMPHLTHAHGDFHEQITVLDAEIAKAPAKAELWLRRGELHHAHGDFDAARADYDKAATLDPTLATVHLARGQLFLQTGALNEAKQSLDRFLEKYPGHAAGLVARARTKRRLRDLPGALADYDQAIAAAREPEPDYYLERAELLAAQGGEQIERAVRGLDEGLARLGQPVSLLLAAIEIEVADHRYDAALHRIDAMCDRTPRKELWLSRRGEVLEKAGQPAAAREAYRAALSALDELPEQRRRTKTMTDLRAHLLEKTSAPVSK
jgi:tetratricopeptide (TPR) repeat protein